MEKTSLITALLFLNFIVFPKPILPDGIYLVDSSMNQKSAIDLKSRVAINFNASLVEDNVEAYAPIVICTNDYVQFELVSRPFIENYVNKQAQLKVCLTNRASEKLSDFTSRNSMKKMAVVVNGEVIAIYKITRTVNSQVIDVLKTDHVSCKQISKSLLKSIVL